MSSTRGGGPRIKDLFLEAEEREAASNFLLILELVLSLLAAGIFGAVPLAGQSTRGPGEFRIGPREETYAKSGTTVESLHTGEPMMRGFELQRAALMALGVAATISAPACHTAGAGARPNGFEPGGTVITRAHIEEMQVRTALEVIERGARHLVIQRTREGSPLRIYHRGVNSFNLNTEVQVVVDGVLMNLGVQTLRDIPATSVESIQILSAREGTTKYGATAGGGVIVVKTTAKGAPLLFPAVTFLPEKRGGLFPPQPMPLRI